MLNGIQLSLMIGPAVPVPVSRSVLEALNSVQVMTSAGQTQSGFELTFNLNKRSPLTTLFLVTSGKSIPIMRVIIVATINGSAEVLMDGVMTEHSVRPGAAGVPSTLSVRGKDLSALMDIVELNGLPYPAMPPAVRVLAALAKYAAVGVIPQVVPSIITETPLPVDRVARQCGTDLHYITKLAEEVGYVFYLGPGPAVGTSHAYWGPEVKVGRAQPALNVDMDAHTNVESLSFSIDKEARETPIVYIQQRDSKATLSIPIPDVTPLNPPLGLVPPLPPKIKELEYTAKLSPLQAALRGVAYAAQHADAVTGSGSLNVLRYGRVLRGRQLVGVRGAGEAFNGLYYVKSVTHNIRRGEYKQDFTLSRNGVLSTVPTVPV